MNRESPSNTAAQAVPAEPVQDELWRSFNSRRPWIGLSLLASSIVFTVAVLIFFGAWFADGRIEDRAAASGHEVEGDWWEDGLIAVCPIH